jgi:integrase
MTGAMVPGRLLFPADGSGRALHPATVYRRVASVLKAAGIPESVIVRRGARTLRNTYAVRELTAGAPVSLVGESMGHVNDRATQHYLTIARGAMQARLSDVDGPHDEFFALYF